MYSYQQTASGQQRPGGDETRPHTLNSRNEILYIAIPEVYPFRYLMMMIHITQTRTKKNPPPGANIPKSVHLALRPPFQFQLNLTYGDDRPI